MSELNSPVVPLKISIITIFPEWFDGPFDDGILFRAQEKGLAKFPIIDLRSYANDNHHSVDDMPYGGGGGMLFKAEPLAKCLDDIAGDPRTENRARVIFTSPKGITWNQKFANEWVANFLKTSSGDGVENSTTANGDGEDERHEPSWQHLVIICGRYEGIDQRIIDTRVDHEVSLGDFVMTGGEITTLAIVDSLVRLIPGVLGNADSFQHDSHYKGLLEGPHYTRPAEFEGMKVPDVLLSGNHAAIDQWRKEESEKITKERRPELWEKYINHGGTENTE